MTWAPIPAGSGFGLENLPYGVVSRAGEAPRVGVRIGDHVLDLALLAREGLLDDALGGRDAAVAVTAAPALNPLLACGRPVWTALRSRLTQLLGGGDPTLADAAAAAGADAGAAAAGADAHADAGTGADLAERALLPVDALTLHLPVQVADYVDFYSSLHHATRVGRLFRPDGDPLLPNWRHVPIGYHGRAGTVVVSGTPVRRPLGQGSPPEPGGRPPVGPSRRLDYELEVGFVTGGPTPLGSRVAASAAAEHVFGLVLVNDWSARDIQAWEYQPLGPFLGKSFATSISPWVVTLDALAPYRVPGPPQDPEPVDYLRVQGDHAYDVDLRVLLAAEGGAPQEVSRVSFATMYWTIPQQLAHATVNGATLRPGDLFASGTVSGPDPGSEGCLLERTGGGREPLTLPDGTTRAFLEDGDTVTMTAEAAGEGRPRIAFGPVTGTILPALPGDR